MDPIISILFRLKISKLTILIVIMALAGIAVFTSAFAETEAIPTWVKSIAGWWSEGKVSDSDFVSAMQFLIDKQIIKISNSTASNNTALIDQLQSNVVTLQTELDSANSEITSLKQQITQLQSTQQTPPQNSSNSLTPSIDLSTEKGLAEAWSRDTITDSQYVAYMQTLIDQHKVIPYTESEYNNYTSYVEGGPSRPTYNATVEQYNPNQPIPNWIKSEAGFWIGEKISYQDYRMGIYYLFEHGILRNPLH